MFAMLVLSFGEVATLFTANGCNIGCMSLKLYMCL